MSILYSMLETILIRKNISHGFSFGLIGTSLLMTLSNPVMGQDGLDCAYGQNLGMHALTDQPRSVALGGSIAYLGTDNGILAYDLGDPETPIHVGTFALSGVERIFTSGNEMFISNGVGGSSVSIVDSSDPSSMSALSTVTHPVGARARDIVREGNLLFIGVDTGNVYVYDISELGSPVLLNTLNYSDPVYGIALSGVRLFAATSGGGAFITDISDIMSPSVIGSLGTDDSTGVRVSGDTAYVIDRDYGMRVYDCSDPGAAFEISSVEIPIFHMFQSINSYDLQLVGDQIFLLNSSNDGTFRYFAYDVSDPMNPVSAGDFVSPYPMSKTGAFSDDLAIFAIQEPERGFEVFDISEMFDSPRGEYIFKTGVIHPNGMMYQIDGTFGTSVELQAFDISDPINPLMVSESPASYQWLGKPEPYGDEYLLSVRPDSGLLIFDVSNPNEIELAGSVALPSFMFQFGANFGYEVVGDLMYYYHSDDGVSIVDLSNTASPMVIGHINFGNTEDDEPRDITGRDGYAYVMLYNSDMVTLDLSDPTNPIEVDRLATDGTFVPLSDRLVYGDGMIAHVNRNTMDFYDVQNPDSPVFMSRYDGGTSSDFLITPHIEGDRAYVATQQDPFFTAVYDRAPDFLMLDISDPTMPLVIGGHETRLATGVYDAQYVDGSVYLSVNPSLEEVFLIEGCNVCLADLTGDGMLNFFDVSAFLSAFGSGDLNADFTGDGLLNFFDVSAFLSAFAAGCS